MCYFRIGLGRTAPPQALHTLPPIVRAPTKVSSEACGPIFQGRTHQLALVIKVVCTFQADSKPSYQFPRSSWPLWRAGER